MTTATQEFVNQRVLPLETAIKETNEKMDEMVKQLAAKDAQIISLIERLNTISLRMDVTERKTEDDGSSGDGESRRSRGILGNPAFRNLESYTGDHTKFSRWRSKVRGILLSEDDVYNVMFKVLESPHQLELVAKGESEEEYEEQARKLAEKMGLDRSAMMKVSKQMLSLLTAYCDETALSIVDGLEAHGELAGLEAWRRLYADQRGTLSQRTNALRDQVLYPERVKQLVDVIQAITRWERAYGDLVEACNGNFKLDDYGKIACLKRVVPQEIVSSMVLVHAQLKSYREARNFVMEQVTEHRNHMQKQPSKTLDHLGDGGGDSGGGGEEWDPLWDPWASGGNGQDNAQGEGWEGDNWSSQLNALRMKGKGAGKGGKGKGCWECGGDHKRSECPQFTAKLRAKGYKGDGKAGGDKGGNNMYNKGAWGGGAGKGYGYMGTYMGKGWPAGGKGGFGKMGGGAYSMEGSQAQGWPPGLQLPMPGPPNPMWSNSSGTQPGSEGWGSTPAADSGYTFSLVDQKNGKGRLRSKATLKDYVKVAVQNRFKELEQEDEMEDEQGEKFEVQQVAKRQKRGKRKRRAEKKKLQTPDSDDDEMPDMINSDVEYQCTPCGYELGLEECGGCNGQCLNHLVKIPCESLQPLVKSSWEQVDPQSGMRKVRAVVDSGASSSCASNSFAPEIEPVPSEGSRRGQTYAAAGGKPLANEGEKTVVAMTGQGKQVSTKWQVVGVNRPLMSVHQICKQGNVVVFGEQGGYVMNLMDGSMTPFGVEDQVYVLDLYLPPAPSESGFPRLGR